jgi:hypothetical protein
VNSGESRWSEDRWGFCPPDLPKSNGSPAPVGLAQLTPDHTADPSLSTAVHSPCPMTRTSDFCFQSLSQLAVTSEDPPGQS